MKNEKIPVVFAHSSSRLYQNCLKKHFNDILPLYLPDPNRPLKFNKILTFFEYVGNNDKTIELLDNILGIIDCNSNFLIIDDTYEGLLNKSVISRIKDMINTNKDITQCRIYSSNKNLRQDVEEVFESKEIFYYFNSHLHLSEFDHVIPGKLEFEINENLRKKKFLCVNRQERYHRLMTIDYIFKEKLDKDAYVSCPLGEYRHVLSDAQDRINLNPKLETYHDPYLLTADLTYDQKYRLNSILPLELDVSESQYRTQSNRMPLLDDYFYNSYFSVVTEGDFWSTSNKSQFTEKVIKCFLYYHPFVVIGLPNTLSLLREMGFLTFSSIIDERYDSVIDDEERLQLALEEIKKLTSQNINQLHRSYEKLIPILKHNRKLAVQYNATPVPAKLANEILQWFYYD